MLFDLSRKKDILVALGLFTLLCIPGILSYNSKTQVDAIRASGSLKLVTRNSPLTYFQDNDHPAGFEYELANAFANYLGVKLDVIVAANSREVIEQVRNRSAHIAGAMLAVTQEREQEFSASPPYLESNSLLIYRTTQGKPRPRSIDDLQNNSVTIAAHSNHQDIIESLAADHPSIAIDLQQKITTTDLLSAIHEKKIDYAVVDEIVLNSQKTFFPGVKKAFTLGEPKPLAWLYLPHPDNTLKKAINRFFDRDETKKLITNLQKKYLGQTNVLNFFDTVTFRKQMKQYLSKIEQYFHMAEQETDINWLLLAAIAYQESHWKPDAVSPTGVKGIMMLTHAAAKEVGVTDRTNPKQSILGGAQYLVNVKRKIPKRIAEPDRTWMALAAYNVGYGHLEDARILTAKLGKNPDKWNDVLESLPLLEQPKYHKTLRYGYANGSEPATYVTNIRKYLKLLTWEKKVSQMRQESRKEDREDKRSSSVLPKLSPLL